MDENLVGYLLKALDADEQRAVEAHLREQPGGQKRLDRLRRRLDLLASDAVDADPPEGLWVNTLALVAEHQCRGLPHAPSSSPAQAGAGGRTWWRRVDVLVAAALLIVVGGVVTTWLVVARDREQLIACQHNLRHFYDALWRYSENNDGKFPEVQSQPPTNRAGFFVPILNDAGVLPPGISVGCPSGDLRPLPSHTVVELEALYKEQPEKFQDVARDLSGCYAYTLGYSELKDGHFMHRGLTAKMDKRLPILADRPPAVAGAPAFANSPNHAGRGQNVLHIGGNVEFRTTRTVGIDGDDIFVNSAGNVAAGRTPYDTVLGRSDAEPYPRRDDD